MKKKFISEKPVGTIYSNQELKIISKILRSQKPLTYGVEIELFEKKFASYLGAKYAVAVSSCGAALNISTKLFKFKKRRYSLVSIKCILGDNSKFT